MDFEKAHPCCFANKKLPEKIKRCGCFNCGAVFPPGGIKEWIEDEPDWSALCPYCGIDSVIGESAAFPLTNQVLKAMHEKYFNSSID